MCFYIGTVHLLLNLADDLSIEIKMVKRDIVNHLIALLDRDNYELGLLVTKFMRKLSVFIENKNAILNVSMLYFEAFREYTD